MSEWRPQMSVKQLQFGIDARARMLQGMDVLANAVKATLGPQGPQRGAGAILRRPDRHQRRRQRR